MNGPNKRNVSAHNREIRRIRGRIKRYADNVDCFTKYPDSEALKLNRELLRQDALTLGLLTDAE